MKTKATKNHLVIIIEFNIKLFDSVTELIVDLFWKHLFDVCRYTIRNLYNKYISIHVRFEYKCFV